MRLMSDWPKFDLLWKTSDVAYHFTSMVEI